MAKPNDDDYDPHLYREVKASTSNFETFVHLTKATLGTGILAIPEAFKHAGMIVGIISTPLIGMLCSYTIFVMVRAQYVLCKKLKMPLLTYPDSMKVALEQGPSCLKCLAPAARSITTGFLILYQLGICCCYIVFVAINVKSVSEEYIQNRYDIKVYIIILFIPHVLIMCIRNLKLLTPFSFLANIMVLATCIVASYYILRDLPSFSDLPRIGKIQNYPLFFGTTLFSLLAIGVITTLENNMKTPKGFLGICGVLNTGIGLVTIIYLLMGMFGYWRYGANIETSITLNFPPSDLLAQFINTCYSISIFISYGLQGYVGFYMIWNEYVAKLLENSEHKLLWEYFLRIGVVVLTFVAALIVPLLGLVISLIGCFCVSILGIAFPAILNICAFWPDELGPYKCILLKDIIIIILGILTLISGTHSCVKEIIRQLSA